MIELTRALAAYGDPPGTQHDVLGRLLDLPVPTPAEYADLFLLQLFPYASVQLGPEGKLGGIARDRVSGFFRALDVDPPPEVDHLVVLLAAYAALLEREQLAQSGTEAWARAREAFLVEHLLSWVPALVRRIDDVAAPAYRAWAALVDDLLASEMERTPLARVLLPAHLAHAEGLLDPRTGTTTQFLDALLAPGRTGVILTASDLMRAAETLGLGRRIAERRFVLRSLLEQGAAPFLQWLSGLCEQASATWATHWLAETPTGTWWRDRSASTALLLGELAVDAHAIQSHRERAEFDMAHTP